MKKYICLFLSVFLSFFVLSNYSYANRRIEKLKINISKILKIGSEERDDIYRWMSITTDKKGNIYITDTMDYKIKKFSSKGILLKKTGRRGQGPGEFTSPGLIDYNRNLIYVTQQMSPGIQVFDTNLSYKYTIPLNIFIFGLSISEDGKIFIMSPQIKNEMHIAQVNKKGEVEERNKKKDLDFVLSKNFLELNSFDVDKGGNIYIAFCGENRIDKYDKKANKIWSTSLDLIKRKKAEELNINKSKYKFRTLKKFIYKDIKIDNDGFIYVLGGHYSKNKSSEIYILNKGGKYISTLVLEEPTHCIYINNGMLYSRGDMGAAINIYKITKTFL